MNYREYGSENHDVILLLHGGGLSWWNYLDAAEELGKDYRVILPILDGHAGSDRPFRSIEENAQDILRWVEENCRDSLIFMGGLSLGGQVLAEILAQKGDVCPHALLESACARPMPLTASLMGPTMAMSYGLIKQNWFSRLQFQYLRIQDKLYDRYYADTCAISKADMTAFLTANLRYRPKESLKNTTAGVHIYVGSKEDRNMRLSAKLLHEMIPGSKLTVLKGLRHGEFSINQGPEYADTVRKILA